MYTLAHAQLVTQETTVKYSTHVTITNARMEQLRNHWVTLVSVCVQHATLARPVKHLQMPVQITHAKMEAHALLTVAAAILAHAHAVTQEPTVRHTQAHARTIHA